MASKLSLKLLVDNNSQKVLFAEASKDFIDFLFRLLTLPVGSVTDLLKDGMVGCMRRLYDSVQNLSETYMQPNQNKNTLLKPKIASPSTGPNYPFLLQNHTSTPATKSYYSCSDYNCYHSSPRHVTDVRDTICPRCNQSMSTELTFVAGKNAVLESDGGGVGFVKGLVTYMVMDDLVVTPMSTISSITLLNKFNVETVGALEEVVVEIGMDEGLALLKASFNSQTVLTDVFLGSNSGERRKTISGIFAGTSVPPVVEFGYTSDLFFASTSVPPVVEFGYTSDLFPLRPSQSEGQRRRLVMLKKRRCPQKLGGVKM